MQILNIAAVSILEYFANLSKGDDKKVEKTIYIVVIIVHFFYFSNTVSTV